VEEGGSHGGGGGAEEAASAEKANLGPGPPLLAGCSIAAEEDERQPLPIAKGDDGEGGCALPPALPLEEILKPSTDHGPDEERICSGLDNSAIDPDVAFAPNEESHGAGPSSPADRRKGHGRAVREGAIVPPGATGRALRNRQQLRNSRRGRLASKGRTPKVSRIFAMRRSNLVHRMRKVSLSTARSGRCANKRQTGAELCDAEDERTNHDEMVPGEPAPEPECSGIEATVSVCSAGKVGDTVTGAPLGDGALEQDKLQQWAVCDPYSVALEEADPPMESIMPARSSASTGTESAALKTRTEGAPRTFCGPPPLEARSSRRNAVARGEPPPLSEKRRTTARATASCSSSSAQALASRKASPSPRSQRRRRPNDCYGEDNATADAWARRLRYKAALEVARLCVGDLLDEVQSERDGHPAALRVAIQDFEERARRARDHILEASEVRDAGCTSGAEPQWLDEEQDSRSRGGSVSGHSYSNERWNRRGASYPRRRSSSHPRRGRGDADDWGGYHSWGRGCVDDEVPESDNLYVKGLPPSMTDERLQRIFSGYGKVVQTRVLDSAGYAGDSIALVRFASVVEAKWVVENLHERIPRGLTKTVSLRFARDLPRTRGTQGHGHHPSYRRGWQSAAYADSGGAYRSSSRSRMAKAEDHLSHRWGPLSHRSRMDASAVSSRRRGEGPPPPPRPRRADSGSCDQGGWGSGPRSRTI